MVSIGTIITLGAITALAAGGYALYRNADKFGGALSRGVEQNITNPLGSYFDSLWNSFAGPPGSATQGVKPGTIFNPLPPAYGTPPAPAPGDLDYKPVPVPTYNNPALPPSFTNPPTSNLPQPTPYSPPTQIESSKPTVTPYEEFREGYYYINYSGSQYDTQWKLTARKAWEVARAAIAPGDALLGIQYIGKSKLGPAGFELFGKTQNYL